MKNRLAILVAFLTMTLAHNSPAQTPAARELVVRQCDDFTLTGDGSAAAWKKTEWEPLHKREPAGPTHETRIKVLYSKTGIYTLMNAADRKITATIKDDFENLWTEDVFEIFLWTDERHPVYFEYEISPLNVELPIIIPNLDGRAYGWRPWHYDGPRKTRKATAASGGALKSGGTITGWTAEVFIPYELLRPLHGVPPKSGNRWRANFYRMDYDDGVKSSWDWSRVGPSFHEFKKFGTLVFE